jgi:drug/metabolite transporter (DMT)-like permease
LIRPRLTAGFALALAILAVSWGAILVRLCQAPALVVAFYRLGLATVILIPLALGARGGESSLTAGRKGWLVVSSGLLLALHFGAWITSLSYTTVASSVVLVSTQPLFSALFSGLFLKEKAPPRLYAGVALALAGTAIIAGGDLSLSPARLKGDILALAGAAAASGYLIIGRRVREEMRFFNYLTLVYGFSALFLGAAATARGESVLEVSRGDLPWLLLMAAGPSVVGHGCFNWAVRKLPVFTVSLAAFGEPILASFYAFLLLGEPLTASLWTGGALVFAGILLALPRQRRGAPAG